MELNSFSTHDKCFNSEPRVFQEEYIPFIQQWTESSQAYTPFAMVRMRTVCFNHEPHPVFTAASCMIIAEGQVRV